MEVLSMKRTRQLLAMASLSLVFCGSTARAADCTTMKALMAEFTQASDAMDSETARNKALAHPPRYDARVCSAARKTAKAIKALMPAIDPACLSSPAAYSQATDSLGSMLTHVGAVEGLSCAPGK
jgi:hypothetical protein